MLPASIAALGRTGAHYRVQLVDEGDDAASDARNSSITPFSRSSKRAPVLRPGHHARQVQRHHLLVPQDLRCVARHDRLRQAVHDRRLAHARVADQRRVVLGAPAQDLDDPPNLLLAADDGSSFPSAASSVRSREKRFRAWYFSSACSSSRCASPESLELRQEAPRAPPRSASASAPRRSSPRAGCRGGCARNRRRCRRTAALSASARSSAALGLRRDEDLLGVGAGAVTCGGRRVPSPAREPSRPAVSLQPVEHLLNQPALHLPASPAGDARRPVGLVVALQQLLRASNGLAALGL